ncbi:MAG TPA: hypothetical protein VMP03_14200 [Methylomirabilota bacterium]|nr:hypothetical protein [Methylomirabilota bacterium]
MAHFAAYPDDDPDAYRVKRRSSRRASSGAWTLKVVTTCLAIAGLMAIGDFAMSWSRAIADAEGRVADGMPIALFVGDQRLSIPANMFRFADQRSVGPHDHVELAVHWPTLEGYSPALRDAFVDPGDSAPVLYLSIRTRTTVTDSAGRLASVYRHFMDEDALPAPPGLVARRLTADSGLAGEEVYFEAGSTDPFTLHCLAADGRDYPALCMTEVHAGTGLSVQLRFRKGLLEDWAAIKDATRLLLLRFGVVS